MSRCALKVVLDHPNKACVAGEKVTGRIEVSVVDDCECQELSLVRRWRTRGRGEDDFGPAQKQTVFSGSWRGGQRAFYPFEFTAPPGPLSYRGASFSVEWYLRAQAALAGALDAATDEEFFLVPAAETQAFNLGPAFRGAESHQKLLQLGQSVVRGCMVFTGGLFLFFSLLFGFYVRDVFRKTPVAGPEQWSALVVWFLILGASGALFIWAVRPLIAARKLGRVAVQVTPVFVRPGQSVTCTVNLQPRGDIHLIEAQATLRGMEVVQWQSGDDTHSHRTVIRAESVKFAADRELSAGQSATLETQLTIPPDAPTTFMAAHNSLLWLIEVKLYLKGWPDWQREFPVIVRP